MPYEIVHAPQNLGLLGGLTAATQVANERRREDEEKRRRKRAERLAIGNAISEGVMENIVAPMQEQRIAERNQMFRLDQMQHAQDMQSQAQMQQMEREFELDLQNNGYVLDFTPSQKQEMAQLDNDEMGLETQYRDGAVRPHEYMRLKSQIGQKRRSMRKMPQFKGPKPPTAQERWQSGDAGFIDDNGVYMMVNPKTGGLEPHEMKNDASEMQMKMQEAQAKAQASSVERMQKMAEKQQESKLKAAEREQNAQAKMVEHQIKVRESMIDLATKMLTKKTPSGPEGKMVDQVPSVEAVAAMADSLYEKVMTGKLNMRVNNAGSIAPEGYHFPSMEGRSAVPISQPSSDIESNASELIQISKQRPLTGEEQATLAELIKQMEQ